MISFLEHPTFCKETALMIRRFPRFLDGLESFKLLCQKQFHAINPIQVITPAKLHRLRQNETFGLWKIELVLKGVRPNHFPRIWFALKGSTIVFLCVCSHHDNYNDNEEERRAELLVSDIF